MLVATKPRGPEWLLVMGASILFDPIDRPMMRRARRAALKALSRPEEDETVDVDPVVQLEDLGDALSLALIVEGVRDWRDVAVKQVDEDGNAILVDGEPVFETLAFSRVALDMLLTDPVIFDAIDAVYVMPFAQRERAKNGFAASPNGTGVAATPAADIVSSPAAQAATGRSGARRARTGSTKPKRKPRTASGKH